MKTRRRELLLRATAIGVDGSLPAPAIGQGIKELRLVTSYPANLPGLGTGAARLAESITAMSNDH
jgi:TRAP-type mannitol/chloroaromatic compound transport system substrate-binding protein